MKPLKYLVDFFLYSNIFISICSSALTWETYLITQEDSDRHYLIFVFLSTFVLYNVQRLFHAGKNNPHTKSERHRWVFQNKKTLTVLSVIALIADAALILFFPLKFVLWIFPLGLLALSYFIPQTNLRAIPFVKAGLVAFVWALATYFYPLLLQSDSLSFSFKESWDGAARLFFLLPLAIAFNIRDVEEDKISGVKTLPVLFGITKTKIICIFFLLIFCSMPVFSPFSFGKEGPGLLFSAIVTAILICFASENRSEYFYSLWLDGMMILQAGLVLFCS